MEKDEEYMNTVIAAKEDFVKHIMPKTRKAIKDHIAEADKEFAKACRIEYLTILIDELELRIDYYTMLYKKDEGMNRIYSGQQILEAQERINKHKGEIRALNSDKKGDITDEMIQRAKEHPFTDLLPFKKNKCFCPYHEEKTPSAHLYLDNHVYCFSCHNSFDTIDFIIERDGKTFADAVKYLQ
jgi:hypothetical protein